MVSDTGAGGARPAVTVVVPHYDDPVRLDLCLAALGRQTLPPDTVEVIVADNGSSIGADAVERAVAGRARIVVATEKGAGPARNAGVAAARAPLLAFTDSDCLPAAGWLAAGIAALARADVIGGRVTVGVEDRARMTGAEAFETVFAFDNRRYVEEKGFSVTANLFCARETFDAVGPFRNGVSEDVDWCWRARAAGYRLGYAPDAVVAHPARRDWAELRRKWQRMNAEGYGLVAGSAGGRARWVARNLLMPLSIAAHVPRIVRSDDLPDAASRTRAVAMLARLRLWRMADAIGLAFK